MMPRKFCGAKAKSTGKPCRNPAGFKTKHVGAGRCHLHGGATPIKHGRFASPEVQAVLTLPHLDRAKRMTMIDDVAVIRALALDLIDRMMAVKEPCAECGFLPLSEGERREIRKILADLHEKASKVDYRRLRLEQTDRALITIEAAISMFQRAFEIVAKYVPENQRQELILELRPIGLLPEEIRAS